MKKLIFIISIALIILAGCSNNQKKSIEDKNPDATVESHGWEYMIRGAKKVITIRNDYKTEAFLYDSANPKKIISYNKGKKVKEQFFDDYKTICGEVAIIKSINYDKNGEIETITLYEYKNRMLLNEKKIGKKSSVLSTINYSYPVINKKMIIRKNDNKIRTVHLNKDGKISKFIVENIGKSKMINMFDKVGNTINISYLAYPNREGKYQTIFLINDSYKGNESIRKIKSEVIDNSTEISKTTVKDGKISFIQFYVGEKLVSTIEVIY